MRLLIADKLHPRAIEELRALPLDVVYEPEITKETLETKLGNVGILVVRSTEVTARAVAKHPDKFIGFACVDPRMPDCMDLLVHAIEDLKLKGVKFGPIRLLAGAPSGLKPTSPTVAGLPSPVPLGPVPGSDSRMPAIGRQNS